MGEVINFVEEHPINTRSQSELPATSTTGVLKPVCIFCNLERKGMEKEMIRSSQSFNSEDKIRVAALYHNDKMLLDKIGHYIFGDGPDFVALEAKYHHSCRRDYLNRTRPKSGNSKNTNFRDKAFKALELHVKQSIIDADIPELASSLMTLLKEYGNIDGEDNADFSYYNTVNLCKRLTSKFGDILAIYSIKRKGTVLYKNSGISGDLAMERALVVFNEGSSMIKNCAMKLRNEVLQLQSEPIDANITVEDILKGEVDVPENLKTFFTTLYTGHVKENSDRKRRLVESSAADAVFACSGSKLLPGKHLSLGLALKSMTASKSVITLLNRHGHCASNETLRRLDMGVQESIVAKNNSYVPDGIKKVQGLCTGLAWDNFDMNIETLSGSGTIHHTYGIAYQNFSHQTNVPLAQNITTNSSSESKKRKHFSKVSESNNQCIEPYYKKPRISDHDFKNEKFEPPKTFSILSNKRSLWSLARYLFPNDVPMWNGWNSIHIDDDSHKQVVCYMDHIQLPPTRYDVVKETLRRSQKVSKECNENYAIVTYDLAVAKIAKQIQNEESPTFDDVFVMFGSFHIELSFFSSIGRIIEGSGGPFAITESQILAAGSLNKFLKGKMYYRCKRGNIFLSTAMHGLHFKKFISDHEIPDQTISELNQWACSKENEEIPNNLNKLAVEYHQYCEETCSGKLGKTAQFWMLYCRMIDIYLLLNYAMKINDVNLFAYALHKLSSIFFVTNHVNYARWMSRYSLELLNLEKCNPVVYSMLVNGGFSVKRSKNKFAREGVDMALEQTINAEAKNRLCGITAFADVKSAVNRWLVTSSMRTEIVNRVLSIAGMSNDDDIKNKDLNPKRMARDATELCNLVKTIEDIKNPFDENLQKDSLFNIKTGKKVSKEAEDYLLSYIFEGEKKRDNFLDECKQNPDRFEERITKSKIINFCTESFSKSNKSKKAEEIAQAKGTRDLFARLLFIARRGEIDMCKVLSFPLTPIPAGLSHPDGCIRTTAKSNFLDNLLISKTAPTYVDTAIIDGMFFLRNLGKLLLIHLEEL